MNPAAVRFCSRHRISWQGHSFHIRRTYGNRLHFGFHQSADFPVLLTAPWTCSRKAKLRYGRRKWATPDPANVRKILSVGVRKGDKPGLCVLRKRDHSPIAIGYDCRGGLCMVPPDFRGKIWLDRRHLSGRIVRSQNGGGLSTLSTGYQQPCLNLFRTGLFRYCTAIFGKSPGKNHGPVKECKMKESLILRGENG